MDSAAEGQETLAGLGEDCAELRGMLQRATRANVRKELQRVLDVLEAELSRKRARVETSPLAAAAIAAAAETATTEVEPPAAAPAAAAAAAAAKPAEVPHKPVPVAVKSVGPWTEVTTFGLDLGKYDSPHLTVDLRLKGVEALPKDSVTCDFTASSFDLKVTGLEGANYRFVRTNLDKDIVPADSHVKVKKNHVIVTLQKVKGQYGYDSWTDLCAKGRRKPTKTEDKGNPSAGIMDMMKDLYEDGDDNMKKIIGEAMYKSQKGEKYEPKDDLKMPSSLDDDL